MLHYNIVSAFAWLLVSDHERSIGLGLVCELDQRHRVGGCIERGCSRKGDLDYAGLNGWG